MSEVGSAFFRWGLPEAVGYYMKSGATYWGLRGKVRRFAIYTTPASCAFGLGLIALQPLRDAGSLVLVIAFLVTAWSPMIDTTTACVRNSLTAAGDLVALRNAPLIASLPYIVVVPAAYVLGRLNVEVVLCAFALTALIQRTYLGWRARLVFAQDEAREDVSLQALLRFGTKSVPAALSNLGNSRLDQLLLVPLLGLSQLGLYSVAVTVGMLPVGFGLGLAFAAFKGMPTSVAPTSSTLVGKPVRLSMPPLAAITVLLAVLAPVAIPAAFGSRFDASVAPCLLLLPGALAMSINFSVWQTANALGRPGISSIAQVSSLVVTIGLLIVFLPLWGIKGAALATSLAYTFRLALSLLLLKRVGVSGFFPGRHDISESARTLLGRA